MRWPVVPTLIVAAAVATMIALGFWQIQRKGEKEAQIALYIANQSKPATAFPQMGPVPDALLYRKSSANCLAVTGWEASSGADAKGDPGIRYIASCKRSGAEGPGFLLSAGVGDRPDLKPDWTGGPVTGMLVTEPDRRSLLAKLFGGEHVLRPMLVSDTGLASLRPPAKPSPKDVTNNHLAYAVQWFLFALIATVIYVLAVRRRAAR